MCLFGTLFDPRFTITQCTAVTCRAIEQWRTSYALSCLAMQYRYFGPTLGTAKGSTAQSSPVQYSTVSHRVAYCSPVQYSYSLTVSVLSSRLAQRVQESRRPGMCDIRQHALDPSIESANLFTSQLRRSRRAAWNISPSFFCLISRQPAL